MKFSSLKKDKLFLILLIIIMILGIFIRLNDFSKTGYWIDDISIIPTGLLWFYPHDYYPGLSGQGEPALGNLIIGASCMLSGEDFSGVSQIKPMFYPGREPLIGEAMINAESYCKASVYIFGILFFIAISILSLSLLPKYSAFFSISFFAFFPPILMFSRWIYVDIIAYTFIILGLLFLWLAYKHEKTSKKELIFFILSFAFFGLSLATKLPNGIYILFGLFIIIKKYKKEFLFIIKKIFQLHFNLDETNIEKKRFCKILIYSIISFFIAFLAPLNFNPKNFFLVYQKYSSVNPTRTILTINTNIFKDIFNFLLKINPIDFLILIFSLFIFYKLLRIKKEKNEEFILYLTVFFLLILILFKAVNYLKVFIMFFYGIILLMSLIFSNLHNSPYSIFNLFKIKRKRIIFIVFILIYLIFSFSIALSSSPYFEVKNPLLCKFTKEGCQINLNIFSTKDTANYLKTILNENETFILEEGIIFYYLRREQSLPSYIFDQSFLQQFGREPTALEKIKYFHPDNRTIRYLLISPYEIYNDELISDIKNNYKPNHIILLNNKETKWVYDIQNLNKKQ